MMKAILTVCFMILFLSSIKASPCLVELNNKSGETVATFTGNELTAHGCHDAMTRCEEYIEWKVKFKKGMSCFDAYGNTNSDAIDTELELDSYAL